MNTNRPSGCFRSAARLRAGARSVTGFLAAILATVLLAPGAFAQGADAEEPRLEPGLYLSWRWHSPYGQDYATDRLTTACDDTSEIDTLYLSFVTPRARSGMVAMTGVLYFYPQDGDTLDPFWFFKRGWPNETNLRIDMDHVAGFPCQVLWQAVGSGGVTYDHRSGRGRLDFEFRVPDSQSALVLENQRYCFARVMIRQKRNTLEGCHQPVCVEFAEATFTNLGTRITPLEVRGGEHRFVTWNSPDGKICDSARAKSRVKAWQPGPAKSAAPAGKP